MAARDAQCPAHVCNTNPTVLGGPFLKAKKIHNTFSISDNREQTCPQHLISALLADGRGKAYNVTLLPSVKQMHLQLSSDNRNQELVPTELTSQSPK